MSESIEGKNTYIWTKSIVIPLYSSSMSSCLDSIVFTPHCVCVFWICAAPTTSSSHWNGFHHRVTCKLGWPKLHPDLRLVLDLSSFMSNVSGRSVHEWLFACCSLPHTMRRRRLLVNALCKVGLGIWAQAEWEAQSLLFRSFIQS